MRGDGALGALELDLMCDKKELSKEIGFWNLDSLTPSCSSNASQFAQTTSTLLSNQAALLLLAPVFSAVTSAISADW